MVAPFIHGKIYFQPLGYQQLASISSATNLSPPAEATIAEIIIETGGSIRYRDDGTSPTPSVGMPVIGPNAFQYSGDLTAIQFIDQATGAVVDVSYYK